MKGISTSIGRLLPFFHQSNTHLEIVQVSLPNDIYIVEASATLVLPIAPLALTGALAIWSAISLDADFIQGVTENGPNGLGYCNDLGTSWCNLAYALTATPDSTQPNITHGIPVIAALGARVKTHYLCNPETSMWDQELYINGHMVSNISTSQGQKGTIFYIAIECAGGLCAASPAHKWESVWIRLNDAYPALQHNGSWYYGATGGEMSTPDGGQTWSFTTLHVPINQP